MTGEECSVPGGLTAALPPHATLPLYYRHAEQKSRFLRGIFDRTAEDYDRVEHLMALGTGRRYRRDALLRAGLAPDLTVLDVAAGTGMVAREALAIVGDRGKVIALEPSRGMLHQLTRQLPIPAICGTGERLPIADSSVDFISMGYALRHLSDLAQALEEFYRVLRPGGRLCILEITAPQRKLVRILMRGYLRGIVPLLTRLAARHADSSLLWQYYWDTIDACVPPQTVLQAMADAGFTGAIRKTQIGIFSEYTAQRI